MGHEPCIRRKVVRVVEAVKLWNEPNNKSHWDLELDPEWQVFSEMVRIAAQAIQAENPALTRVMGGISPIDESFIRRLQVQNALQDIDVLAVHGFPLDWNLWSINDWPAKVDEIRRVSDLPIWVTEVGVSSFGAEEVQLFGLERTAELLIGRVPMIHWYSLFDLPRTWEATTRHREAEGSSYYRHFYMGLIDDAGNPKLALRKFAEYSPNIGLCQWFHFEDHRLDDAVRWLRRLGVKHLRTGLSWADWHRPNAESWFDRQMSALDEFDVTVTLCFTPPSRGMAPHYTSPPQDIEEFAEFCATMVNRYAPGRQVAKPEAGQVCR
jgi:beta-xylosidase